MSTIEVVPTMEHDRPKWSLRYKDSNRLVYSGTTVFGGDLERTIILGMYGVFMLMCSIGLARWP